MPRKVHPVTLAALNRGESLADVAAAVGVTPGSLNTALRRGAWPSLQARLAEHFGVDEVELFGTPDDTPVAS